MVLAASSREVDWQPFPHWHLLWVLACQSSCCIWKRSPTQSCNLVCCSSVPEHLAMTVTEERLPCSRTIDWCSARIGRSRCQTGCCMEHSPQERYCKSCRGCSRVAQAQHRCSSTCLLSNQSRLLYQRRRRKKAGKKENKHLLQIGKQSDTKEKAKAFILSQFSLALELGYVSRQ